MSPTAPGPARHQLRAGSPALARRRRPASDRPNLLIRLVLALVITLTGTAATMVVSASPALAAGPRLTAFDSRMLELVNGARQTAGVPALQAATGLTKLSLWWSGQMADGATSGELKHNPNAFDQTLTYGAANRTAWAENVAKWTPTSTTADAIFDAYMNSAGHRANILGSSYRYIGIGSVTASNGASFDTMTFTDNVEAGQVYTVPRGNTDSVTVADGTITVTGWAYDPNSTATSIPVHVYVNGAFGTQLTANGSRADVNSAFGLTGGHGFSGTVPAVSGTNTVCLFALSVTGTDNTLMTCKDVSWSPEKPPAGSLDSVGVSGPNVVISGWTYDPAATSTSNTVTVKVNGAATTITANGARNDVNSAFGISGSHGYSTSVAARSGSNQVCVTANTVPRTATADLGCRTVNWSPPQPAVGAIDGMTRTATTVTVSGWAFDPSAKATSNQVHLYVNGVGTQLTANKARNDVNAAFGLTGNHGYTDTVTIPAGNVTACLFSISASGGDNTLLGCRALAAPAPAGPTYGSVDTVQRTAGGIRVAGWVVDPAATAATIPVDVYVNGVGTRLSADGSRPDVNNAFRVSGLHGYNNVVAAPASGSATVCIFAISVSGGTNTLLQCRSV